MSLLLKCYYLPIHGGGRLLNAMGFSPNGITLSAILLGFLAAALFVSNHNPFLFAGLIFFGTYLDALDGEVARRSQRETRSGAYFDAMADRIFEATTVIAAAQVSGHWVGCFLLLASSNLVSYAKAWTALVVPISNHGWPALMGREGRTFSFTGALILWGAFPQVLFLGWDLLAWSLLLINVTTLITAGQRMVHAQAYLNGSLKVAS